MCGNPEDDYDGMVSSVPACRRMKVAFCREE